MGEETENQKLLMRQAAMRSAIEKLVIQIVEAHRIIRTALADEEARHKMGWVKEAQGWLAQHDKDNAESAAIESGRRADG
jgi:hypothetical protein